MGQSIRFYYKSFEQYIIHRRNKHNTPSLHEEFEKLYKNLGAPKKVRISIEIPIWKR